MKGGLWWILPTPFDLSGEIQLDDIERLVDLAWRARASGVVALGLNGEAHKLSDQERRAVLDAVLAAAAGRLPVAAGTGGASTRVTIERTVDAAERGAVAVMVAPPPGLQSARALEDHYREVSATGVPIVVQDEPVSTGVLLPPELLGRLAGLESVVAVKVEEPPTPRKVTQIARALPAGRHVNLLGGLGGVFLLEELGRGAAGTMTGFAYPEVLTAVIEAFQEGDRDRAREAFYRYLPLIRFEGQVGIGLAIRKALLQRRGLLRSAALRRPAPALEAESAQEAEDLRSWLGLPASPELARITSAATATS